MNRVFARRALTALGSGVIFSLLGGQALAQDTSSESDDGNTIVVTGSRIQSGMDTPVPITAVTADELETLSPGVLIEGLTQLPQFSGSNTPSNPGLTIAGSGPGALNLRGIGANRTLVLMNGRRLPSTSRYGTTDVNALPETFVKRVDTVTGGASAAYGADAIAGVVNFVLDTNYTGLEGNIQGGITDRGDNKNWQASLAGGFEVGDRLHVLLSAEYQHSERIDSFDGRDYYKGTNFVQQAPGSPGARYLLRDNVVSANETLDGLIQAFFPPLGIGLRPVAPFPGAPPVGIFSTLSNTQFLPDGSTAPFTFGDPYANIPGFATHSIANGGSGTDIADDRYALLPESERANLFAYAEYEVSDNLTVYAQGMYGRSYSDALLPGGGLFVGVWPLEIFPENAFLPTDIRDTMLAENLDSIALFRVGSVEDLADNHLKSKYDVYSGTFGFDAQIADGGFLGNWNVSGYYTRSRTKFNLAQTNATRTDRYPMAVDAVVDPVSGEIVCNVTLYSNDYDDCVPINLFGRGNASAAAIDYVTGYEAGVQVDTPLYYADTGYSLGRTDSYISTADKVSLGQIDQDFVELTLDGEVSDGFGAGPIMAAVGASYRSERLDQIVRAAGSNPANDLTFRPVPMNDPANGLRGIPFTFQAEPVDTQFSAAPNVFGSLSVKEAFAEILLPLVQDAPVMQQLNLIAAARWADYSATGGIWAWKFGLDAQISDALRIRGTASRDIRAPNFADLFEQTSGAEDITDPFQGGANNTIFFDAGGNPNLNPEVARTYTLGAVFTPGFAPGFSLSADWYQITLSGAIGSLSSNEILTGCFEGDAELCARIERNANTGAVTRISRTNLNLNEVKVSGIDIEASYRTDFTLFGGNETFSTRLFASWLDENSTTLANGVTTNYVGQVGYAPGAGGGARSLPEWKATASFTYANGPFTATLQERYIGPGFQNANPVPGVTDIDFNKVSDILYTDLRLSYRFMDDKFELYGAVTNLMDTSPPPTPSGQLILLAPYNSGLYDLLGRRYTAGVKVRF